MSRFYRVLPLFLLLAVSLTGCGTYRKGVEELRPLNDEVLFFPLNYDLTYLRVLEAVQVVPGWDLMETEKPKGIIVAKNIEYKDWTDKDLAHATFIITRVSGKSTSVKLSPWSQRVVDGDKLLQKVNEFVSREI